MKTRLAGLSEFARQWMKGLAAVPFVKAQRLFLWLTIGTILIGGHRFYRDLIAYRKALSPDVSEAPIEMDPSAALQPLEYYLASVRKRHLFRPRQFQMTESLNLPLERPILAPPPQTMAPPPAPVRTLADLSARWILVGINGTGPYQAIIVDQASQKTHYLFSGETLGEVRIIQVQKDRVTLGYNNEAMDLLL